MKKSISLVIFVMINFSVAFAQQKLTPETLWQLGRVSDPQLSPDGNNISYNVRTFNVSSNKGNTDIWIYNFKNNSSVVIANDSSNETQPRWSTDSKRIYFLNDKGSNQLWSMNTDGSDKKQESNVDGDINMYGVSASGNMIWYAQDVKLDKFMGKDVYPDLPKTSGRVYDDLMMRHWDTWADGTYSHVFIAQFENGKIKSTPVDILKGEHFDSPLKPHGGEDEVAWSPDGKKLVYTCKKLSGKEYAISTNSDIYLYDVASGKTENLTNENSGYDKSPVFSPDGSMLAWQRQEKPGNEADRERLFLYEFKSKAKRELSVGFNYNAGGFQWNGNSKRIYFISNINATSQIFYYDFAAKEGSGIQQLTKDVADYVSFSLVTLPNKEDKIVASRMSISEPNEVFSVDLQTGASKELTYTNKAILSGFKMGDVKKRMVKSTDGKDILTWVIYPPDFDPAKKYPTLLYCQGGPQSTVSQFFSYRWNFQLMAANGYIIVAPNRRGMPGFGPEWNDEISGDWGGQAMNDLLSAIDDVANESYVNKDKLGAVGASFGGYSVFWLEGHHNKRFKTFIAHCGVFNLESMNATEELFFQNNEFEGPYWQNPMPKSYTKFSPHRFVQNWDAPILIIANEKDYRVPYTQGLEAYSAARQKNIPARFLSFPDEGHWVVKPQNSILWQRTFFDWPGQIFEIVLYGYLME